jgi:hypothetical protein
MDMETGSCNWVIVKGNELMKRRVKDMKSPVAWRSVDQGLTYSLKVHSLVAAWSVENWRWYLDYLEGDLNETSRPVLEEGIKSRIGDDGSSEALATPDAEETHGFWLRCSDWARGLINKARLRSVDGYQSDVEMQADGSLPLPPIPLPPPAKHGSDGKFCFLDLQKVQGVEEKVNEALLVMEGNMRTLTRLRKYYNTVLSHSSTPSALRRSKLALADVERFAGNIKVAETDTAMFHARARSLLRLVEDRKTLVSHCKPFCGQS